MRSEQKRPRCPTLRHSENEPVTKKMLSPGRTVAPTSLILVTTAWCCHYSTWGGCFFILLKQKDNYSKCYFCLNRLILTIKFLLIMYSRILCDVVLDCPYWRWQSYNLHCYVYSFAVFEYFRLFLECFVITRKIIGIFLYTFRNRHQ